MEERGFDALLSDREMQAEFDRRVAKAIETARGKWDKEIDRKLGEARAEGERAAGMSYEEKLSERERALTGRERELSRRELRALAAQSLSAKGLPGELADAINCDDREAFERSIESAEKAFRGALQAGIAQRLGGAQPALGAELGDPAKLTDDQYYAEKLGKR